MRLPIRKCPKAPPYHLSKMSIHANSGADLSGGALASIVGMRVNIRCISVFRLSPLSSIFFCALIFEMIFALIFTHRVRGRYDKITYSSSKVIPFDDLCLYVI